MVAKIQNKANYLIESRINEERCILYSKDVISGKFSFLGEKHIFSQNENQNLYILLNSYLGKRGDNNLRVIHSLGFDVDTKKEGISDGVFFKA